MTAVPQPTVLTTSQVVSCLPEGHDDRWTYTIQVKYRGSGLYTVSHNLKFADADGNWEYQPGWPEDPDETDFTAEEKWRQAHSFDHDTAIQLAKELAPTLVYRGRTVAQAFAGDADA